MSPLPHIEPGASTTWADYWGATSPSWDDWMFGRLPSWVRVLDEERGFPLKRFLRIFGRAMNQTQGEADDLPFLLDLAETPDAYLRNIAATLGLLLPGIAGDSFAQRRLLANIVQFYQQKGTVASLQFVAYRYLGLSITITDINPLARTFRVTYDESVIPREERDYVSRELARLIDLHIPAGWTPRVPIITVSAPPQPVSTSEISTDGDVNVSFELNHY